MKKEQPLVTIITATFNIIKSGREEVFRRCVESVHNQSYQNIEHLIIDGGSKDGTIDLLEEYLKNGLIKYISEPDKGVIDAVNKGAKLAKGKYLLILGSDDFFHNENGIEESVKELEKQQADFSYAQCFMNDEENPSNSYLMPAMPDEVFFRVPFILMTMLVKKSVFIKEGCFDENLVSADCDFILNLFIKKYKGVEIKCNFASYSLGGISSDPVVCEKGLIEAYYKNYSRLCKINREEVAKLLKDYALPLKVLMKLPTKYLFKILKNYKPILKKMRKFVFSAKLKKKNTYIQILGIKIYQSKEIKRKEKRQELLKKHKNISILSGSILTDSTSFRFDANSNNAINIGKNCLLSANFIFETNTGEIKIGDRVFINSGTDLISRSKIEIGDDVTIAWGVTIYDHNAHSLDWQERKNDLFLQLDEFNKKKNNDFIKNWDKVKTAPIKICDKSWIGFDSLILSGVTIGEGAVVGAKSVVRNDVEPYTIVAGNPAVKIGEVRRGKKNV